MASGYALNRNRKVPAEDTPAFGAIAERFRRAGDLERAIALCQDGLRRFPDHLSARVTLGWSLLDLGRYDEAREALGQVLKRAPDNLAAIRGLAELHDRAEHTMMLPMDGPGQWPPVFEQAAEAPAALDATADPAVDQFEFPPALAIPIPASIDAPPDDEAADVVAEAIAMVADAMPETTPVAETTPAAETTPMAEPPLPDARPASAAMTTAEPDVEAPVFVTASGAPLEVSTPDIDAMIATEPAIDAAPEVCVAEPAVESAPEVPVAEPETEPDIETAFAFASALEPEAPAALDLAVESPQADDDLVQLATADLETMAREMDAEAPPTAVFDVQDDVSEELGEGVGPAAAFADAAAIDDSDEIAALEALIAEAADDGEPGFELQPQSIMAMQAIPLPDSMPDEDAPPFVPDGQGALPLTVAAEIPEDDGPVFALEAQSILALMSASPAEDERENELEDEPESVSAASGEMPLLAACEIVVVEEPEPIAPTAVEPPRRSPVAALERMLQRVQARRMLIASESVA